MNFDFERFRKFIHPTIIVLSLAGIGWFIWTTYGPNLTVQAKQKAKASKLAPPAGEIDPQVEVDRTHAQPATGKVVGSGLEYHSSAPKATPPPETSKEAETTQVEYTNAPLVLCDSTPSPTPTPAPKIQEEEQEYWLPRGTYIPFVSQCALDSSHMTTPFEAVVTEDVFQWIYGKPYKIISAGDRLLAFAANGYIRERVEIKGKWSLIYVHDGTEVEFDGIACDMEYNPANNRYDASEEKSAGLKGKFIQSDRLALLRNAIGLLLTTGANTVVNAGGTILEQGTGGVVQSFNTSGTAPFIDKYVSRMINPNQIADTLFVRIPAGKTGYVLTTSVIQPKLASMGAKLQRAIAKREESPAPSLENQLQNLQIQNISKQLESSKEPKTDETTDPNAALK